MLHPDTHVRWINERLGNGVFATSRIPAGTITWIFDERDSLVPSSTYVGLPDDVRQTIDQFGFSYIRDFVIVCGDDARFMNHSCDANCHPVGPWTEMAIRDICPGEQLTNDYRMFIYDETFACSCGRTDCAGEIKAHSSAQILKSWKRRVEPLLGLISTVPQPLLRPLAALPLRYMSGTLLPVT